MNFTTQVPKEQAVQTLEATLHVATIGARTEIKLQSLVTKGCFLMVNVPNEVWREFCRRQLAVPPPLPKGGVA